MAEPIAVKGKGGVAFLSCQDECERRSGGSDTTGRRARMKYSLNIPRPAFISSGAENWKISLEKAMAALCHSGHHIRQGSDMIAERTDYDPKEQASTQNPAGGKSAVISKAVGDIGPVPFDDLSHQSKMLWAKLSDIPGDVSWLPLAVHMSDSCGIS